MSDLDKVAPHKIELWGAECPDCFEINPIKGEPKADDVVTCATCLAEFEIEAPE